MRRPEPTDGFRLCFALNLLWELPWVVAALVLLVLRYTMGLPGICWRLALAAWVGISLVKTRLIAWAGETSGQRDPVRPNKNPYSAKNPATAQEPPAQPDTGELDRLLDGLEALAAETAGGEELTPEGAAPAEAPAETPEPREGL